MKKVVTIWGAILSCATVVSMGTEICAQPIVQMKQETVDAFDLYVRVVDDQVDDLIDRDSSWLKQKPRKEQVRLRQDHRR